MTHHTEQENIDLIVDMLGSWSKNDLIEEIIEILDHAQLISEKADQIRDGE